MIKYFLLITIFQSAWALPENLPSGLKFSFLKKNSETQQVCVATPVQLFNDSHKCLVKFFTAAHCAAKDFDYFKADFISGRVPLPKNGLIRHPDYLKFKGPGLDFARFSLKMPCSNADKLFRVQFPKQFQREGKWPEVALSIGERVYVKNLKGFLLSGTIQMQSNYAFAFKVKIDGEHVAGSLVRTEQDLSPGDSGAPILNEQGEVVGVVSGRKSKGTFYFSSLGVGWINSSN